MSLKPIVSQDTPLYFVPLWIQSGHVNGLRQHRYIMLMRKFLPPKLFLIVNSVIIFLQFVDIFGSKIETSYPIGIYDPWIE